MVFMARGIRKKWKQPIAFYFIENGMHHVKIATTVKEVIRQLEKIGLHVIATICDQSAANVSAVKFLKEETASNFIRLNQENRMVGFSVDGKEVLLFVYPVTKIY